jgi:hypothetical protein
VTPPSYIQRGGDLAMLPPLALQGATTYWFTCVADQTALQTLVDAQLNAVAGPGTYTALGPFLAIVCANVTKSFSMTAPDSQKGWMSERDFGVWVPVMRGATMLWYLPYVFVDNVAAMVTGRDVFGFFKQVATLTMPANPQELDPFTVNALVIQKYGVQSQALNAPLLTLAQLVGSSGGGSGATWATPQAADQALSSLAGVGAAGVSVTQLLKAIGAQLVSGNIPMVFLKQIRGCTAASDAAYQAVVEAPAHLDTWTNGGLTSNYEVTILPCDSHPIATECGLPVKPFSSAVAFWCQMDFTMMPGTVIASS